ncbi:MAG: hypothetical protein ACRC46_15150 [Thermoguttaceae bacterium]
MKSETRPMFTWIPLFRQVVQEMLNYEDRRDELIPIANAAFDDAWGLEEGTNAIADGVAIDPFQILACLTFSCGKSRSGPETKIEWLQTYLDIKVARPADFDGTPRESFAPHWCKRKGGQADVDKLWNLAIAAYKDESIEHDFDACMQISRCGKTRISDGLFLLRPDIYLPVNQATVAFISKHGVTVPEEEWDWTGANYIKFRNEAWDSFKDIYPINCFPLISEIAQREWENSKQHT